MAVLAAAFIQAGKMNDYHCSYSIQFIYGMGRLDNIIYTTWAYIKGVEEEIGTFESGSQDSIRWQKLGGILERLLPSAGL